MEKHPSVWNNLFIRVIFLGLTHFLGIKVLTADSHETMRKAIIKALSVNEPVIINAIIDPEDYKWLIVKREEGVTVQWV